VLERWPSASGRGGEYRLTPAGKDIEHVVFALGEWSVHWLYSELDPTDVDPITLTWWMHRHIDPAQLPPGRVVVQFDHTAPARVTVWIVFDRGEASVCKLHPGFDSDVVVTCTTGALGAVFSGRDSWSHAVATASIRVDGPPRLARALPRWFTGSVFKDLVAEQAARVQPDVKRPRWPVVTPQSKTTVLRP
jgi:hypothetical protein